MSHSKGRSTIDQWLSRLPFFYGWAVVAIAFITVAISVNARSVFSLLFPSILAEMQWDRSTTAGAFSIGFMTSAFVAPLMGYCMDRLGPRYVISAAALVVAVGLSLTTRVSEPWHLYVSFGLMVVGASIAMSYLGHGAFLPNWFVRRRGLALGVAFSGVGVGAIFLFPWLQTLIDGPGWREACKWLAILLLLIVYPLNLLAQRKQPADLGLEPDGDSARADGQVNQDNVVDAEWVAREWTLRNAAGTARFWWLFAGISTALFAWYAIQVHQTRYLLDVGYDATTAALALGMVPFCGLVGQVAIGHLSDQVGREWSWTLCCLGFALSYLAALAMPIYTYDWILYVMIGGQGLLGYGLPILISAISAELFAGRHFGAVFGAISVSAAIGPAAGPWMTGLLFDQFGNYVGAFWLGIALCCVSVVCIWFSAPRKVRSVAGRTRVR